VASAVLEENAEQKGFLSPALVAVLVLVGAAVRIFVLDGSESPIGFGF